MTLTPLTSSTEIRNAFNSLSRRISGGLPFQRTVGWKGGSKGHTVYWHPQVGIWGLFQPDIDGTRHWFAFGTTDPNAANELSIVCEINPPNGVPNRRCAGVFLHNQSDRLYLAHSGKVGGGRPGIGKLAFDTFYRGGRETVLWPDGTETTHIVIGEIESVGIMEQIARFVRVVQEFKASVVRR